MQVKTLDGTLHEIDAAEARRIYHEMHKHVAKPHTFRIGGVEVAMTADEMKAVADAWWEHFGKSSMEKFWERHRDQAGENIRKALKCTEPPVTEDDVKGAISMALAPGYGSGVAGEVIFEAMEWQTAYSGLKSIEK